MKRIRRKVIVEGDIDQKIRNLQAKIISNSERQISFSGTVNLLLKKAFEKEEGKMIPKKKDWDAEKVPIVLLFVIMTGAFFWAMYGIQHHDLAIIVFNSAAIGITIDLTLKKLIYHSGNVFDLRRKISNYWVNANLGG